MKTFFGAGGLGDLYICLCKALSYNHYDFRFNYIHSIGSTNYDTKYHKELLDMQKIPGYEILQNNPEEFFKSSNELVPISTSWDGKRSGIIRDGGWPDPFMGSKIRIESEKVMLIKPYILIQSSAGFQFNRRPDRMWSSIDFMNNLCKVLNKKLNYNIYIIGKDEIQTECPNLKDLKLGTHMNVVKNADLFVGFAGFLSFVASTNQVPVIMKEHEYNDYYMHPVWNIKTFKTELLTDILIMSEQKLNERFKNEKN